MADPPPGNTPAPPVVLAPPGLEPAPLGLPPWPLGTPPGPGAGSASCGAQATSTGSDSSAKPVTPVQAFRAVRKTSMGTPKAGQRPLLSVPQRKFDEFFWPPGIACYLAQGACTITRTSSNSARPKSA